METNRFAVALAVNVLLRTCCSRWSHWSLANSNLSTKYVWGIILFGLFSVQGETRFVETLHMLFRWDGMGLGGVGLQTMIYLMSRKRNNLHAERATLIHSTNFKILQRSATNFKARAQRPGVWRSRTTTHGNLVKPYMSQSHHIRLKMRTQTTDQSLNRGNNVSPGEAEMFYFTSLFSTNAPGLVAEIKWLLLGIASYMSLCNATAHSLF